MGISAADVKQLRDRTGAGMMDCKRALTEAGGDLDEAVKVLRTQGLAAASKKAHRAASEGAVVVIGDDAKMVVLELNCETDFVARNPKFQEFANLLAEQVLSSGVGSVEELLSQRFSGDDQHTVEEAISQLIATIGENVVLSRVAVIEAAPDHRLSSYVHGNGKIGVVVEGSSAAPEEALHDVALHVAASEPRFTTRDEVTDELLQVEREIALKQAIDQGKPEHIAEKIVAGKMEKFFEQEVLLEQPFAKDTSKSVAQYVRDAGGDDATVARFVRFKLGEVAGS
jgi:elongation factor Ts